MAARRGSRRRAAGFVFMVLALVAAAVVAAGYGSPAGVFSGGRRLQPGGGEAAAMSIQIAGLACGSHLALAPAYIEAKPGSMLRIANEGLWPHEIYLSTEDRPVLMSDPESRRRVLASVRLEPGDTGELPLPDGPGDYYLVPGNTWHFLSGLRGQVRVEQPVDMPAAHRRANVRP